jgi:hypothetical protein
MMRIPRRVIPWALAILLFGCGEDDHRIPTSSADENPPARVLDLRFLEFRDSSAVISWTAPGDDGVVGIVSRYDVRLATAPMTPPTWAGAAEIPPPASPRIAGAAETMLVSLRPLGSDLWVALNAVDDAGNWSGLSNVVQLHPNELHWWNGFSTAPLCCGVVWAIILHEGALFVGGDIRTPTDDVDTWVGLARWNGSAWDGAGWNLDFRVHAFATYRSRLIAVGSVQQVDGPKARVVRWDGSGWLPLGNGLDGVVNALAVYHDRLIAAGSLGAAEDTTAATIASWDDRAWRSVDGGPVGTAYALTVFEDRLIVGGSLARVGGVDSPGVAAWDGSTWQPLAIGIEGITVRSLAVAGGMLFAGGSYENSDSGRGFVASWDGSEWTLLPAPGDQRVSVMAEFQGSLVIGGLDYGWYTYGSLLRWGGSAWRTFGPIYGNIQALFVDGTSLYVGGSFDRAGPWETPLIARWDD